MDIITAEEARKRTIHCKKSKSESVEYYSKKIAERINESNSFGLFYCVFDVNEDDLQFFRKTFEDFLLSSGYVVEYSQGYYNIKISWK
ncbi:MAG: hypothetical protein AAFQ94_09275 [Bacteroidota bacterium]